MKNHLRNWNFMRILRLGMGTLIIVQSIIVKEWMLAGLGGLFCLMPLMNIGCCSISGCSTSISKTNKKIEDITYEEVG